MLEYIVGFIIGVLVCSLKIAAMRQAMIRVITEYNQLLVLSQNQYQEYWNFRKQYEQYRARFDPIVTTEKDNVVTIERGEK